MKKYIFFLVIKSVLEWKHCERMLFVG